MVSQSANPVLLIRFRIVKTWGQGEIGRGKWNAKNELTNVCGTCQTVNKHPEVPHVHASHYSNKGLEPVVWYTGAHSRDGSTQNALNIRPRCYHRGDDLVDVRTCGMDVGNGVVP